MKELPKKEVYFLLGLQPVFIDKVLGKRFQSNGSSSMSLFQFRASVLKERCFVFLQK